MEKTFVPTSVILSPDGMALITVSEDEDSNEGGDWKLRAWGVLDGEIHDVEDRRVFSASPSDGDQGDCEDCHVQASPTPSTTSKRPALHPRKFGAILKTQSIPKITIPEQLEVRRTSPHARKSVTRRLDKMIISTTNLEGQSRAGVRQLTFRNSSSHSRCITNTAHFYDKFILHPCIPNTIVRLIVRIAVDSKRRRYQTMDR